jgi:outer membrane lipoprotein LolB
VSLGRRLAATAAVLALLTLLGACATKPPAGPDWLAGRLTVKVDAEPVRQFSSAFELQGDGERGELRLSSPLGTQLASAVWAPGEARLVTADGERRYTDLDALARDALSEALPLRALPSWLRGKPWPGAEQRPTANGFEQLGWHVSLARYAEGWLDVSRTAPPPAVTLRARLEHNP